MSNDNKVIGTFIKSLNEGPEKFDLTDEGDIKNYLGVKIERLEDGSFEMKPPFQIDRILKVIVMETIRNRLMSSNHRTQKNLEVAPKIGITNLTASS